MGYSAQVMEQARAELARQRADRESRNAARLQEAYARLPQLKQIDIQLRATMAQAARAVFSGAEAGQAMEQARQENLALQARRKELVETHFAPGYLDEEPVCPHCGGNGYIGAAMCQCLKKLCIEAQRKELGAAFSGGESFENFRLDYYSEAILPKVQSSARTVMEKNLNICRQYARHFGPEAGNLLLCGGTGLGKTHLALAIGRAVGEQGCTVCYETAASLFSKLEKARFYPSDEARAQAERLERCDLLIIDDLGTELPGQFVTAALYALLNQRLMDKKPMVITTNLLIEEARTRYSPQIASRLQGEFFQLAFLGSDIRILKNRRV